jgi:hypothetical protein
MKNLQNNKERADVSAQNDAQLCKKKRQEESRVVRYRCKDRSYDVEHRHTYACLIIEESSRKEKSFFERKSRQKGNSAL